MATTDKHVNHLPRYTKTQFIDRIKADASESCGIPITVNNERMEILLERARRYFYQNYDGAKQKAYIAIDRKVFEQPRFRETRKIRLPDCIHAVFRCAERGNYLFSGVGSEGNPDPDFSPRKYRLGAALLGSSNDLVYSIALTYYNDFVEQFNLHTVSFEFNPLTRDLIIVGRDPKSNLVLSISEYINEDDLYSDDLFYKYMLGQALKTISKPLGVFQFKLIGGTALDLSEIKEDAAGYLEEVKEAFEEQRGDAAWFIIGDQLID